MFRRACRILSRGRLRTLSRLSLAGVSLFACQALLPSSPVQMQSSPLPSYPSYDLSQDNHKYTIYLVDYHLYPLEVQQQVQQQVDFLCSHAASLPCNQRKGLQVQVVTIDTQNPFQKSTFEDKYGTTFKKDSLILLKNSRAPLLHYNIHMFQTQQFQVALKFFNKPIEVTRHNIDKFLGNRFDSDVSVLCLKNTKGSSKYKERKEALHQHYYHPHYDQNVLMVSLNDSVAVDRLAMQGQEEGQVSLLKPAGKKVKGGRPIYEAGRLRWLSQEVGNLSSLQDMADFVEASSKAHQDLSVFSEKGFPKRGAYVEVVLEVDLNKVKRHEYRWLIKALGEVPLEAHQQLLLKNTALKDKSFRILLKNQRAFRADYDSQGHEYSLTHEYEYEGPIQSERLKQFVSKEGQDMDMLYRSAEPPEKHFYSRKVVGSTYRETILESQGDQALMMMSKSCHGCKVAGKQVEQIAKDSLAQKTGLTFNRMDSDLNKVQGQENYAYTPVIMMFKQGHKHKPYLYRNNTIMDGQLKDFFYVTAAFSILDQAILEAHLSSRQQAVPLLQDMLASLS